MWITPTVAQIQEKLAAPEYSALGTAATQVGQTIDSIVGDALARVVSLARGYVGSCARNALGPDGTIPEEVQDAMLAILRRNLFTRLPGMKRLYDEIRQQETKDAFRLFQDIAAGHFRIIPPTTEAPGAEQPGSPVAQVISAPHRQQTRQTLSGL